VAFDFGIEQEGMASFGCLNVVVDVSNGVGRNVGDVNGVGFIKNQRDRALPTRREFTRQADTNECV
jgi:hypothetical protein